MSDTRHVSPKLNSPVFHDGYSSKGHFTDLLFLRILQSCGAAWFFTVETVKRAGKLSTIPYFVMPR